MNRKTITKQGPNQTQKATFPVRTALFGGAALLILFAWLQLILALQIASTERQIQITIDELSKLKRDNMALVQDTAIIESEASMTKRAEALGYGLQTPVYLSLGQTYQTTGPAVDGDVLASAGRPAGDLQGGILSQFLLDDALYETATAQKGATSPVASPAEGAP